MSLTILRSREERLVGGAVGELLRGALAASGEVVLLVPSLEQALDAQRVFAGLDGLSLGVSVSTPDLWVRERWGVWGDGRELVTRVARELLVERTLGDFKDLGHSSGMITLLADLAAAGLPWFVDAPRPEGVTDAEAKAVEALGAYAHELERRELVEPCVAAIELPALMRAAKVQSKARQVGFDWDSAAGALEKIHEEADEVRQELEKQGDPGEELGDLLFSCVNTARLCGKQPELLLKSATEKFIHRFEAMENLLKQDGKSLEGLTLHEMDVYWEKVKASSGRA